MHKQIILVIKQSINKFEEKKLQNVLLHNVQYKVNNEHTKNIPRSRTKVAIYLLKNDR